MRKPYVYLYASSVALGLIGFLLVAFDLAVKSQGASPNTGILALLDPTSSATQAGLALILVGVYHFILGFKVDSAYNSIPSKTDLLDGSNN